MPLRTPPHDDFREPGSAPRWRIGVGAAIVLTLVVLGVLVLVSALGRSSDAVSAVPLTPASAASSPRPSPVAGGTLFVHILGRVVSPGLYEVPPGSRAIDVVTAAGGFRAGADEGALNLARTVADGEQIVVPARGAAPAPPSPATGSGSSGSTPGPANPGALVDLNTADATALEGLNGVGPATAAAILAWRDENGRFEAVDDLLDVTGIGEKKLEALRDQVVVR